jgi:hypothetical protein
VDVQHADVGLVLDGGVHGLAGVADLGDDEEAVASREPRTPARVGGWSSAMRTRIGA